MGTPAYDAIAEWYDTLIRQGGLLHDLVLPAVYALMGKVDGRLICDLACGQGLVARHLAQHGAKVMAVDLSSKLLKLARQYPDTPTGSVTYIQGDAQALPLQSGTYDGVVCNMALMDIPDLAATVLNVTRILRPQGWFICSITHPCLETIRAQARWMVDTTGLHAVTSYFVEGAWRSDNPDGVRGRVLAYHRTLSTYLNTLRHVGLTLERLLELQAPAHRMGLDPSDLGFPTVLVIQCKKFAPEQVP